MQSPIDGFVSHVNVNTGKYLNPADILFELINPQDIHAALTVFEKDISRVSPGQKVTIRFVDDPKVVHEAGILLVTRNVDTDRSALMHCHFEKQLARVLPGMFLNAAISTGKEKGLVVPESALVRDGSRQCVLEETAPRQFRLVPVNAGVRQGNTVVIAGGHTHQGTRF